MEHDEPMPNRSRARTPTCCVALLSMLVQGCSLAFVKPLHAGPPATTEGAGPPAMPECTDSSLAPAADTILGGVFLVAALAGAAGYASGCGKESFGCLGRDIAGAEAAAAVVPALGFLGSAWYGHHQTGKCRAAKQKALVEPCGAGQSCGSLDLRPVPAMQPEQLPGPGQAGPWPPTEVVGSTLHQE